MSSNKVHTVHVGRESEIENQNKTAVKGALPRYYLGMEWPQRSQRVPTVFFRCVGSTPQKQELSDFFPFFFFFLKKPF